MLAPINLVRALPTWIMFVGIALAVMGGTGFGYVQGLNHGYDRAAQITETVAAAGAKAQAVASTKAKINEQIVKDSDATYTQERDALMARFHGDNTERLRLTANRSSTHRVRHNSAPPAVAHGGTANPRLGAGSVEAEAPDICPELAQACTLTTLQLLYLQQFNENLE